MEELSLEEVVNRFEQWRATRVNRSEPIPLLLWSQAVSLYPKHKRSVICSKLGLNGAQLKSHLQRAGHSFSNSGFVLASRENSVIESSQIEPSATPSLENSSRIELQLQGENRLLKLFVCASEIGAVLTHVGGLL